MQKLRNIKLIIQYDGTAYVGWQAQSIHDKNSIQGCIENALLKLTGDHIALVGSGRTDSGVHAIGQVANFKTSSKMTNLAFVKGLNSLLDRDIRIVQCGYVSSDFHALFSARSRVYCYVISTSFVCSPFLRDSVFQ